jgi:hypothetical protein
MPENEYVMSEPMTMAAWINVVCVHAHYFGRRTPPGSSCNISVAAFVISEG